MTSNVFSPNPYALGTVKDFNSNKFFEKAFLFQLMSPNLGSSYADSKTKQPTKAFPASYGLKLEVEVFDRTSNPPRKRVMRLVKGERSIWADEQTKPEPGRNVVVTVLDFIDGNRLIDGTDTQMLTFLMNDPRNDSAPNRDKKVTARYRLVDMARALDVEIEKDILLTKLKQWCYLGPWHEVKAYARALNRPVDRDPNQVRADMVRHAVADPNRFNEGMKNDLMLKKHYVLEAIEMGVLERDPNSNSINWSGSGVRLVLAPAGHDAVDFYVDYTQTKDGADSYDHLISKLGISKEEPKKDVEPDPKHIDPSAKSTGISPKEAQDLLDAALTHEVIVAYGKSAYAFDKDGKDERKFVGSKKIIETLMTDATFLAKVRIALQV